MRLVMTADAVGGVWQYATDLAEALVPHGTTTTLAVLGPAPDAAQRARAARISALELVETGLPLDWLCDGPAPVLAAGTAIARLAEERGADLVHLNTPTLAAEARYSAPVVVVAHGCLSTWWAAASGTAPDPSYGWQGDLMRAALARADRVIAPSASFAATLQRHYELPATPHAVHNGRAALPLPVADAQDRVFTAGRLWDEVKNTALLDRVAAAIPVPFRAAGAIRGPHGETAQVRSLQPLGTLDEVALAAELATRPIFVSATSFEPFGLAVLEAATAGCPLVLAGIDPFRELWTGAALFVDPVDEAGFVAAIERVRTEPGLREHLGDAARLRADRYTPAIAAANMVALYETLVVRQRAVAA